MKYVLLAIFVLLTAQPLRASLCDMCNDQGAAQSPHGDMHGGNMDHGNMQDMDCCDHAPANSEHDCDTMSHCGACTASVVTLYADMTVLAYTSVSRRYISDTGGPLDQSRSPPFRPPIA